MEKHNSHGPFHLEDGKVISKEKWLEFFKVILEMERSGSNHFVFDIGIACYFDNLSYYSGLNNREKSLLNLKKMLEELIITYKVSENDVDSIYNLIDLLLECHLEPAGYKVFAKKVKDEICHIPNSRKKEILVLTIDKNFN
ncbi:MAG: hypothetical protein WA057_05750 [Candidatus Magasanikiibacteriota bacterium]